MGRRLRYRTRRRDGATGTGTARCPTSPNREPDEPFSDRPAPGLRACPAAASNERFPSSVGGRENTLWPAAPGANVITYNTGRNVKDGTGRDWPELHGTGGHRRAHVSFCQPATAEWCRGFSHCWSGWIPRWCCLPISVIRATHVPRAERGRPNGPDPVPASQE